MIKNRMLAGIRRALAGMTRRYRWHVDAINTLVQRSEVQLSQIENLSAQLATMQNSLLGVHQSVNQTERLTVSKDGPWRCLFIVHSIETWSSLHDVWQAMNKDPRFEPIVASIPRQYPGSLVPVDEQKTHEGLCLLGVPHLRLYSVNAMEDLAFLRMLTPHMIFRQSHWDSDISPAFSAAQLSFARLYYVPYGIAPLAKHGLSFQASPLQMRCNKIFVVNELVKRLLPESLPVEVTGHPRIDFLQRAEPSWPIKTGNQFKIIWSAHHATETGWNDFGVFWQVYRQMLALAQSYPEIDFLFSPHPALLTRFSSLAGARKDEVDEFKISWNALPNTGELNDGNYAGPFKAADLMIVDGLSFLMEFQLNQKPVLFFERPDHSSFNAMGEIVKKGVHPVSPENSDELMDLIRYFLAGGRDPLLQFQRTMVEMLTPKENVPATILQKISEDMTSANQHVRL